MAAASSNSVAPKSLTRSRRGSVSAGAGAAERALDALVLHLRNIADGLSAVAEGRTGHPRLCKRGVALVLD